MDNLSTRETADPTSLQKMQTSADHAELAAKAERCTTGDPWYKDDDLRGQQSFGQFLPQDRAFIAAANPATVLALLSEIAELRGLFEEAQESCRAMVEKFSTLNDEWFSEAQLRTQAERQRDELRKALEEISETAQISRARHVACRALANQGADQ